MEISNSNNSFKPSSFSVLEKKLSVLNGRNVALAVGSLAIAGLALYAIRNPAVIASVQSMMASKSAISEKIVEQVFPEKTAEPVVFAATNPKVFEKVKCMLGICSNLDFSTFI